MPSALRIAALQLRAARRIAAAGGTSVRDRIGRLDERLVFVVGSPRSGTTFLAGAIGSAPGFVDLGELAPFKAMIPELVAMPSPAAARKVRRLLSTPRRLGLIGSARGVEQTPETAFVVPAVVWAFPEASVVHIIRDGRDVVCSLLDRGWLNRATAGKDDVGHAFGAGARFWVERSRAGEFERASDARRAAWAWRCYVSAALEARPPRYHELRYEHVVARPRAVAAELAAFLAAPEAPLAAALAAARDTSVGRFRQELTTRQLEEVEAEAGDLLTSLGYGSSNPVR